MSFKLVAQVMEIKVGSPLRKIILIKLADQANDEGICWPSYETIARACEISKRSVITHIQILEAQNFLRIEKRYNKDAGKNFSNRYHLTLDKGSANPALVKTTSSSGENPALGDAADSLGGETVAPEPINEPTKEPVIEPIKERATKNPEPQILETNQSGFAVTEDLEISEKTKTVRSQKADQVLNWQEPTIATAKEILFLAGKEFNLTGTEYRMSVEDFKAYYADQADLGKGLTPRMIQPRFRDWLINDVNKKSRQQPQQTNYQGNNHANHQSANSQYQQPKQSSADQYAAKLAEQRRQRDEAANNSAYGSHHGNVYDMETHF